MCICGHYAPVDVKKKNIDFGTTIVTHTAGPLRTARYVMTPLEPFSVKKSSLEWQYVGVKLW